MEMLIREDMAIHTPEVSSFLSKEAEVTQVRTGQKRLVVEIASIHEGITANHNLYTKEELAKSVDSWMLPYPKPILLNHDMNSEPMGRMVESFMKTNLENLSYIALRASVTDPVAMAKVMDGRYLTGSVGGMPTAAMCSICGDDVVASAREGTSCGHRRGGKYDDKVCVYQHKDIKFYEYSFVNAPGDSNSIILNKAEESTLNLYSVDMENKTVEMISEADGAVDLRHLMSEAAAHSMYMDLAFGVKASEALAKDFAQITKNISSVENTSTIDTESDISEEDDSRMTKKVETKDEEDILSVTDKLTNDLAAPVAEEAADEAGDDTPADDAEVKEEETSDSDDVVAEETVEDAPTDEAEVKEEEETKVDDEVVSEESGEDEPEEKVEEEAKEEDAPAEDAPVEDSQTSEVEEDVKEDDSATKASIEELQARIAELESENEKLQSQNVKMKESLHGELASKVVDARIATGMLEVSEREEALKSHLTRSAASLADALVDIRAYAEKHNFNVVVIEGVVPSLDIRAQATEDSKSDIVAKEGEEEVQETVVQVKESDVFVNELSKLLSSGTDKYLNRK